MGRGFNKNKSHPILFRDYNFYSIHAECAALLGIDDADSILVVRINKSGRLAISKPCSKCRAFLKRRGIRNIGYINKDGKLVEEKLC